jgi:ADP-ribose pyrophosphatase
MDNSRLKHWETLKREEIFAAPPWLKLSVQQIRLPDGRIIDDYYQIDLQEYVALVVQVPDGSVMMMQQYRQGLGRVSLVLPGGGIEKGEDPLAAAQRELLEETGYVASDWQDLGCFTVSANYGCGKAYIFAAKNAQQVAEPNSGDLEDTEIVMMQPEKIVEAVSRGEVAALGAVAAIALALNPVFNPMLTTLEINE